MGGVSGAVKKAGKVAKRTAENVARDPRKLAEFGLTGGLSSNIEASRSSEQLQKEAINSEEEQRKDAAKALAAKQKAQGTSALASAEDLSRSLASDPTAQVQGGVAASDKRSGVFSGLLQNIEARRSQILGSKSRPGRKSTILTR